MDGLHHTQVSTPLKYEVVTPPALLPVTTEEMVEFLRLPTLDDVDLVNSLTIVAREYVETITRQTLITTTFDMWLNWFPSCIILPARPLQSITFIKWTDQTGTIQTLDPSKYLVDSKGTRPTIIPPLEYFFPIAKVQTPNAVQVRLVAGYGDTPSTVPESYKLMIKQFVALNYNQREAVVMGETPAQIPHGFSSLLNLNKTWEV